MNKEYNPFSERNLHSNYDFRRRNNKKLLFFIIFVIIISFLYTNYNKEILSKVKSISEEINFDIKRNETFIEQRTLELVNEERTRVGVYKLAPNDYLNRLAKKHSIKMMEENFFEHSNNNVGENIMEIPIYYAVEGCGIVLTNEQIAKCMVDSWIDSPEHYSNMININYFSTGIGISCNIFKCKGTQNFF